MRLTGYKGQNRYLACDSTQTRAMNVQIDEKNTYTASATPARIHLVSEKYLCAPLPLAPKVPALAPRLLLGAFKHKYLGLAQLRNDPIDASTEATARTVRCIFVDVGGNNVQRLERINNIFQFATEQMDGPLHVEPCTKSLPRDVVLNFVASSLI
jgi:hypothetical protein